MTLGQKRGDAVSGRAETSGSLRTRKDPAKPLDHAMRACLHLDNFKARPISLRRTLKSACKQRLISQSLPRRPRGGEFIKARGFSAAAMVEARDAKVVIRKARSVFEFEPPPIDREALPWPDSRRAARASAWRRVPSAIRGDRGRQRPAAHPRRRPRGPRSRRAGVRRDRAQREADRRACRDGP